MKTKNELAAWINECFLAGNSVPMCVNGGGFSMITPSDAESWYKMEGIKSDDFIEYANALVEASNEDYDTVEDIKTDYIMSDFKDFIDVEDYTFFRINHNNGYNQDNAEIQIATYEL